MLSPFQVKVKCEATRFVARRSRTNCAVSSKASWGSKRRHEFKNSILDSTLSSCSVLSPIVLNPSGTRRNTETRCHRPWAESLFCCWSRRGARVWGARGTALGRTPPWCRSARTSWTNRPPCRTATFPSGEGRDDKLRSEWRRGWGCGQGGGIPPYQGVSSAGSINPFTPKSDQFQIPPATSPEVLHHTVWRTWLFIAYSDERWLYYQFSLPHFSWGRLGECTFWTWE